MQQVQSRSAVAATSNASVGSLRVQEYDFGAIWGVLRENVMAILRAPHLKPSREFIKLDRDVHKLTCSDRSFNMPTPAKLAEHAQADPVARRCWTLHYLLEEALSEHVTEAVLPRMLAARGVDLVGAYVQMFEQYKLSMKLIQVIFRYLRGHAQRTRHGTPVHHDTWLLGMAVWRERLFEPIRHPLMQCVLNAIQAERETPNSSGIPGAVIRKALTSLINIADSRLPGALYAEAFEAPFLAQTEVYCRGRIARLEALGNVRDYMLGADSIIRAESRRTQECFDRTTGPPLMKCLFKVFVEEKLDYLFGRFDDWIDNPKENEIALKGLKFLIVSSQSETAMDMFRRRLEQRVDRDGRAEVLAVIQQHGAAALNVDPTPLMQGIFTVYGKFRHLVVKMFDNHAALAQAVDKGCRRFVNQNDMWPQASTKAAETLARYVNVLLKPPGGTLVENFEQDLGLCVNVFALLNDRDTFGAWHGQLLAARLIYNGFNAEAESRFISRIKDICGHDFTYKWQRMFNDATIHAPALKTEFAEDVARRPLTDVSAQRLATDNFVPLVLMAGSWPIAAGELPRVALPAPLSSVFERFCEFYTTKHQGRRIQFVPQYSYGVVRTMGRRGETKAEFELALSHAQLCILLLFNEQRNEGLPLEAVRKSVGAVCGGDAGLDRQLQALVGKKILTQQPNGGHLAPNPELWFPQRKVSLLLPRTEAAGKSLTTDADPTQTSIADRKFPIQCAVMRVMKSRKSCEHQALIAEVLKILSSRFVPTLAEVKANIDLLLEKEYLVRSDEDAATYQYVAS